MVDRVYVYTVRDLMKIYGLSENSVRKALRNNQIPHFKIGSRIIIPAAKIDQLLGVSNDSRDGSE